MITEKSEFYYPKLKLLMDRLKGLGAQEAIVAGGFPRDLLFGKAPKDIDVFYTGNLDSYWLGEYTEYSFNEEYEGDFEVREYLHSAITTNLPFSIQLIKVQNLYDTITNFPISISKCWFARQSNHINMYNVVEDALTSQVVWVENNCPTKYLQRIGKKYPEMTYVPV